MKKRTKTILLIALCLITAFFVSGCSLIGDKIGEKAAEKAIEKSIESSSGGNAKVDVSKDGQMEIKTPEGSMKIGSTYDWPSSIPSDVPKFTGAKITGVIENSTADGKGVMVTVEGAAAGAGDAYKTAMEQAGWKISYSTKSADGSYSFAGEKDNRTVALVLTPGSSDQGITGWVSYSEKTK